MRTRPEDDPFVSIKVPASIRRSLMTISAKEGRHCYQLLADMILIYIESQKKSET